MKADAVFYYVLSLLEGGLSGACFYRGSQAKGKEHKLIWYLASALLFASSVIDSVQGCRTLKAMKAAKMADMPDEDGGNDND